LGDINFPVIPPLFRGTRAEDSAVQDVIVGGGEEIYVRKVLQIVMNH
jgi:hypothetical protein